ncbi:hypothetical protein ETH_00023525 [Eimeria tenella]|uniref:Uncharacterized protein n=1 Tax=Eimeria tenella TaxID=5802 RepID=U6KZ14_EIMTE|nr:hypothetical protein ETH_00023525 [Eimeria tenella]CDJ42173.1 hypothetical protein ETH_00023525 [Eimeria tenella]|eukprot:XP_013232923.1 hypothetical protein ETH_00023525 [Eimeria tenella]
MPGLTKGGQGTLLPGEAVHPTDEAAQRALQRMMGGRLKAEDALSALELQADKWEAWMRSVTPGTMTDAQAAKFAAYQEQLTALKEKQGALREKIQGELKKMRDELTSTAAQLRADLFNLKDWKRVYEEELLLTELASARLTDSIAQEAANETAEAEIQSRLENSTAQVQQLHQELQKQQGSCWLLDDERAAAQHDQKTKATALLAALGLVHVPSETLAAINKKLNDA